VSHSRFSDGFNRLWTPNDFLPVMSAMDAINHYPTIVLVLGLLALVFGANEIGYRVARKWHGSEPEKSQTTGNALKVSIIGLVALLLGFSYSMTTSRFESRQQLVLNEANAAGTCYLRAGLLPEPERSRIRNILRRYVDVRLEYFEKALDPEELERTTKEMDALLAELWSTVEEAVRKDGQTAHFSQIVPAANEVIDLSATRAHASRNYLPPAVLLLLAVCMVISAALMGHTSGQVGHRHLGLWIALNVLTMLVLFVVLDFDRPRRGLVQVDHRPLIEFRDSIRQ
jgi:hypothetical protein